ncbi:CDP-glycerol glycerophosphotransferase family protein [Demequina activiva]|uniref:CDP-glycerol glycerophosphotransferase n=1 Tax=Demequina activiva TaxID=1582364 RepID=A0A919Q359_9MICO|nr:CDP-glycerol glycerophosphotransferase family protein [Demequina activiva]GIG55174.1 hypothetical protein Dac01nite_19260 [Demequina activiva]
MGFATRSDAVALAQSGDVVTLHWRPVGTADAAVAVADDGQSHPLAVTEDRSRVLIDLRDFASEDQRVWHLRVTSGGVQHPVRPGRLLGHAELAPVVEGEAAAIASVTKRGNLVIRSGTTAPSTPKVVTRSLWCHSSGITVRARAWLPAHGVPEVSLVLRERGSASETALPVHVSANPGGNGARRTVDLRARVAWADVVERLGAADVLDAWLEFAWDGLDPVRAMVPGARTAGVQRLRTGYLERGDMGHAITPFLTFKAARLSLRQERLSRDVLQVIRTHGRGARARALWRRATRRSRRPLWVIGERPERFQDTAAAFFAWASRERPDVDIRAVVSPRSPDFERAASVGTVIAAGSADHARAVLDADRIIGSHHPDYLYPVRAESFRADVRGLRIFLQHGVMGTKWMADLYGRDAPGFETDLVIASSERERDLLVRDFGYQPRQIAVTGLSRFDTLLAPHAAPARRLLVIPTWRDWLTDPEAYAASEYHREWHGLLTDPEFRRVCQDAGLQVTLSLHPNMRAFVQAFEDAGVQVVHPGEQDVQGMILDSAALLTDFSSVGFDAALLHRPVLYFQFDRDRFLGRMGSHLDLDADLPGEIAFTRTGVLAALRAVVARDMQPSEDTVRVADSYYPARDQGANERIFDAIAHARRTRTRRSAARVRARAERIGAAIYRRLRASSLYLPLCKAVFRVASVLPRDHRRVVFESGVGKQFGDSPRAIYEEVQRSRPGMRPIWAFNGRPSTISGGAEVVKRLSLRYFLHLGLAKYWVSNQSFPHYVRSDSRRVYIQTWHGTPLKRMLHDLDQITGRDEGYVHRATTAAQQWTTLLSPNPHTSAIMRSAFRYRGSIAELGYPRNDALFGAPRARAEARVRRAFHIPADARIVLFAPTFRDDLLGSRGGDGPAGNIDATAFAERFGRTAVLLVRKHVVDRTVVRIPEAASHAVHDASAYPDTQDLLAAADVLVTDYSSLFFDYANLRRPMVFHAPDLERYRDELRGFYLDFDTDLPGPVTRTTIEALDAIGTALRDGSLPGYDLDAFAARYCPWDDGLAARRVVEQLMTDGG